MLKEQESPDLVILGGYPTSRGGDGEHRPPEYNVCMGSTADYNYENNQLRVN